MIIDFETAGIQGLTINFPPYPPAAQASDPSQPSDSITLTGSSSNSSVNVIGSSDNTTGCPCD